MNAQVLSHFPMPWLTCIALLLFFSVFMAAFARTFAKSNSELYRRIERLPLSEDAAGMAGGSVVDRVGIPRGERHE